jgi:imidazolonepropionase
MVSSEGPRIDSACHVGSLAVGQSADLVVLNAASYLHLGYRPGVDLVSEVFKSGKSIYQEKK